MITAVSAVALMGLFTVKHFVADFLYQPPYQWQNKRTLGHPGGILHSGQHAVASFLILLFFAPLLAGWLAIGEFFVHYFTDWSKMNLNERMGWGANTHNEFWILLGVDQLIHGLTYVAMTLAVVVA